MSWRRRRSRRRSRRRRRRRRRKGRKWVWMWMWINQLKEDGRERRKRREARLQRERWQRKKSTSSFESFFFVNLIGFARLPLEKNGPSPKSKAKKIQYI